MTDIDQRHEAAIIWDYFKPRHTHAWNMLVISRRAFGEDKIDFEVEYRWENFIIRLWLYRTVIKTLTKITPIKVEAGKFIKKFDRKFSDRKRKWAEGDS